MSGNPLIAYIGCEDCPANLPRPSTLEDVLAYTSNTTVDCPRCDTRWVLDDVAVSGSARTGFIMTPAWKPEPPAGKHIVYGSLLNMEEDIADGMEADEE